MKQFFKNNILFLVFFIFSTILECVTLCTLTGNIFMSKPWLYLLISLLFFSIYNFIKSKKVKEILLLCFLIIQSLICLFCVVLYDNTGSFFDYNMLQITEEALASSAKVIINYWYVVFIGLFLVLYSSIANYVNKKYSDTTYRCKISVIFSSICLSVSLISQTTLIVIDNRISKENFMNNLYENTNEKYSSLGQTSSFLNELYKMIFFNKYNELSNQEIEDYIYDKINTPTDNFGIDKNNNLVTILAESLEWFPIVNNKELFPNGTNFSEETINKLFPNITKFYNMSVVMDNHYSRNKTDMSELEALLGSLPSNKYVAYNYADNNMASSIAYNLKNIDPNISNNYFHNNTKEFYDRENVIPSLGYENVYFSEDMEAYGVSNHIKENWTTLNLDSEMVEGMKDVMFPTDKRFNTHITTMSMHGNYFERAEFIRWEEKLDNLNINIDDDSLKNYIVSAMEFDCALGMIIDDLNNKGLMNNTTIVLFSDHNAYMSYLSNDVKDIYNYSDDNYTELFRIPLMIYSPHLDHQIINKFTTTYDITPTVLDMFGINYYTNLYYGNSIFSKEESVLYSKAFDVFVTDKLYFSNIYNLLYNNGVTKEQLEIIEDKSLDLLEKIYYTNHIFEYDYFSKNNYLIYFNDIN